MKAQKPTTSHYLVPSPRQKHLVPISFSVYRDRSTALKMHLQLLSIAALTLFAPTCASPVDTRLALSAYAPFDAACPSTPLVRPATGLSASETAYISARKPKAKRALAAWLSKTNSAFKTSSLPTVGFTSSGGGLRALLETAGVVQSFDSRDSNAGTSGLFQGLTYESGLSGEQVGARTLNRTLTFYRRRLVLVVLRG